MIYYSLDALVKVHGKIRRRKIQYTVIVNIRTHGTTRGREMATQRVTKCRTARHHFWRATGVGALLDTLSRSKDALLLVILTSL